MRRHTDQNDRGFVIVGFVFGVGLFALGLSMLIISSTTSALIKNRNTLSGIQTFFAADSALHEGAYQMIKGSASYAGGTFETLNQTNSNMIVVTDIGWPNLRLDGTASSLLTGRTSSYRISLFPSSAVFDHAIYSQDDINISGNTYINGNIFADGDIDVSNAAATIDGDAYSVGTTTLQKEDNVTGDSVTDASAVAPPTIDLAIYHNNASTTGTIFTDASTAKAYIESGSALNKVIYIENASGDALKITTGVFTGTLIVEGDLEITGGTISTSTDPTNTDPLVIYVGGDIKITGNPIISGIIFVNGNTTIGNGTGVINGSLISAGPINSVDVTGNININYVPLGWLNISGLDTASGDPPRVISWMEQ